MKLPKTSCGHKTEKQWYTHDGVIWNLCEKCYSEENIAEINMDDEKIVNTILDLTKNMKTQTPIIKDITKAGIRRFLELKKFLQILK